ncbi:kinase-like domain-containing protein [Xylaria grammica]|nr:kinase-like domain-containing protein [Xylaria grammica]
MGCYGLQSPPSGVPSTDDTQGDTQPSEEPTKLNTELTQANTKSPQSDSNSLHLGEELLQLAKQPVRLSGEPVPPAEKPGLWDGKNMGLSVSDSLRLRLGNQQTADLDWNKLRVPPLSDCIAASRVILYPKIGNVMFTPYHNIGTVGQWVDVAMEGHFFPAQVLAIVPDKEQVGVAVVHGDTLLHIFFGTENHEVAFINQSHHPIFISPLRHESSRPLQPLEAVNVPVGYWTITARGYPLFEIKVLERIDQPTATCLHIKRAASPDKGSSKRRRLPSSQEASRSRFTTIERDPQSVPANNPLTELQKGMSMHVGSAREGYWLTHLGTVYENEHTLVWRGLHSGFPGMDIVVKVIKTHSNDAKSMIDAAKRWMREITIHGNLENHTAIVPLVDYDARFFCLYIKYIDAKSLWRHAGPDTKFSGSLADARKIFGDVAAALSATHANRIVHGDIKPSNILYSAARGAVMIDFGLSFPCKDPPRHGGTPWYLPPEYAEDWKLRQTGADIWALGISMLWMLGFIDLPDKTAPGWQISDMHPKGLPTADDKRAHKQALENMANWVNYIELVRSGLREDDELESIVSKTLTAKANARIDATSLCELLGGLSIAAPQGDTSEGNPPEQPH